MKSDRCVTKDDVARLTRGKPSKGRVGSRQIRHRLRRDELERLAVARGRGYLLVNQSTRTALKNAWYLDCVAASRRCLYVERAESTFHVSGLQDGNPIPQRVIPLAELDAILASDDGEQG